MEYLNAWHKLMHDVNAKMNTRSMQSYSVKMMHDDAKTRLMQMIMQQYFSASDDAKMIS